MKHIIILTSFLLFTTCSKNNLENENCRFLLDIGVNVNINLNLPQFSQLKFAGNSVYIPNQGNAGIIIAYTGADYLAWDAADPNHVQRPCSRLVNSGLNATCGCDDKNEYNLVNGQGSKNGTLQCSLRNYRVERNGNSLRISF